MGVAGVPPVLGIIGGSGIYDIDGLEDVRWEAVASPFGEPSDQLMLATLDGLQMVFLPRHGRGHRIAPSGLNYRANIDALKRAGVSEIISLSAVGSLREDLAPGMFVLVDQFIDRSFAREKSFFGTGMVAHVSMAEPVCSRLGVALMAAADDTGVHMVGGGTYLVMEGPQFSTRAESALYRSWDCAVIGMTNMPEAKLAREAEICYATVAMVTDYDCWHDDRDAVSVDQVIAVLTANADRARDLVRAVAPRLARRQEICGAGCQRALDHALITVPESRDKTFCGMLDAVAGRLLD